MSGWDLKQGELNNCNLMDSDYWNIFEYIFSSKCKKRNSYKFGIIKSIIDNIMDCTTENNYSISYTSLFERFIENYWNIVLKYQIKQMRKDGKSEFSKIEAILKGYVDNNASAFVDFDQIEEMQKQKLIKLVTKECRQYVLGALYADTKGTIYGFDLQDDKIFLNKAAVDFILKNKSQLQKLNYYWAQFLESINEGESTSNILSKLESSTNIREYS